MVFFTNSSSDMISKKSYLASLICIIMLASCSYIQIEKTFHVRADDWQMYGGGENRSNVAQNKIQPPLTKLWEYNAGGGFSGYSVAIVDSTLFIGTLIGEVHLINLATGEKLGTTDFGTAIIGTPIPDEDVLYVPLAHDEMSIVAYNVRSGKNEWQQKMGDIETSPLLRDGKLFVTTLGGKLVCLNKTNGENVWTFTVPATGHSSMIHSSPASDGHAVFFGADNGSLYAVDINDGKLLWQTKTGGAVIASPSVIGGKVFFGSLDQTFYACDANTGTPVWKRALDASVVTAQAIDQQHVFVGTTGGSFYCMNKDDGTIVWKYTAKSVFNAAPIVTGDVVYAGCTDRTLYAFQANTGEVLWKLETEGRIKTMPVAWKEYLVVLTEDDVVMAFRPEGSK
jgi:outer membrane protein assembly factor BamB